MTSCFNWSFSVLNFKFLSGTFPNASNWFGAKIFLFRGSRFPINFAEDEELLLELLFKMAICNNFDWRFWNVYYSLWFPYNRVLSWLMGNTLLKDGWLAFDISKFLLPKISFCLSYTVLSFGTLTTYFIWASLYYFLTA